MNNVIFSEKIEKIANNLRNARSPIILTGSGCSVHLGIPDFNSGQEKISTKAGPISFEQTPVYNPFGLNIETWNLESWKNSNPEVFRSLLTDFREKILVNNGNRHWLSAVLAGECLDETYKKLSLIANEINATIVTQNIDRLHKLNSSGEQIVELFGNYADPNSVVLLGGEFSDDIGNLFIELEQDKYDYCLVIGSKLGIKQSADVVRNCLKYDVVDLNATGNNYLSDRLDVKMEMDFQNFVNVLYLQIFTEEYVVALGNGETIAPQSQKRVPSCDLSNLKVFALVGEPGTGKSSNAFKIATQYKIEAIIDDGLLIYCGNVQAGESAKRYLKDNKVNMSVAKNAVFMAKDNPYSRNAVRSALELGYSYHLITGVMILSTGEEMVERIRNSLDLPLISKYIRIEEVTTPEDRADAKKSRCENAGHAQPGGITNQAI